MSQPSIRRLFRAPYSVPNGLQPTDAGLWVVDQITDRVSLVTLGEPNEYGVTKWLREIPTESSNTSGLTASDGVLWLAANGDGSLWRDVRPTDAKPHMGEIFKVDPATGTTLGRYPVPGGGGVHGIEADPIEPGYIWVTTLKDQTLTKIRMDGWQVEHVIPLPYKRAHGVVRDADGVWVVHTADRVIVKLDVEDGRELDRIFVPADQPEPHCLARWGDDLIYCDATSGWIAAIH